ncbi:hypothetical protein L4D00_10515 [Photobacterium swingsii]|uniref:hypothetical protein n=1 Tax=Photobacterium swingsii TaxID=680026 RepID=UPI00352F0B5B
MNEERLEKQKGNFCHIQGFKPGIRSLKAIEEMNKVIEMSSLLERIIPLLPFYSIFAGRKTYGVVTVGAAGWQANTYDWDNFRKAMLAIPAIKRRRLENIANMQRLHSKGKEYEFWTCVYNSL